MAFFSHRIERIRKKYSTITTALKLGSLSPRWRTVWISASTAAATAGV